MWTCARVQCSHSGHTLLPFLDYLSLSVRRLLEGHSIREQSTEKQEAAGIGKLPAVLCSYAEKFCYKIVRRACIIQKYTVISYEIDITFCLELSDISKLKPTLSISTTEFTYLNMSASGRPPVGAAFINAI